MSLICKRCLNPLRRASLKSRDVREIVERFYRGLPPPTSAMRCDTCKTIFLATLKPTRGTDVTKKRYTAGEVRFRTAIPDQKRITWLLENHPERFETISSLLRVLILREYERLQPKITSH